VTSPGGGGGWGGGGGSVPRGVGGGRVEVEEGGGLVREPLCSWSGFELSRGLEAFSGGVCCRGDLGSGDLGGGEAGFNR